MEYIVHIVLLILIYIILGISLNLLMGYTGLFTLVHAGLFGIGGYAYAWVTIHFGIDFFSALIYAIVLTAIMGVIVAISALRVKAEYFILLTLGFQMVIYGFMMNWYPVTRGTVGLTVARPVLFGIKLVQPLSYLPLMIILAAICFLIIWRMTHSPFGRVLKAMREDEDVATSYGKDTKRFKVFAFMIGGGLAAVAGVLFTSYTTFISPNYFTIDVSIFIIAVVALGGTANLWGSVIGAIIVIALPEILTLFGGEWSLGAVSIMASELVDALRAAVYGGLLIVFMRFRPQGIIPEYAKLSRRKRPVYKRLSPEERDRVLWGNNLEVALSNTGSSPVEVKGLVKAFGGLKALEGFSFSLPERKITALIGPNGAGKTTVFNLMTNFLSPDGGKICCRGRDITGMPSHRIAQLGLVRTFQGARVFPSMKVLDNVLVARPNQKGESLWQLLFTPWRVQREERENIKYAMACLEFVGLAEKAYEMASQISFADQKMLQIACLLAAEPDIMLLDEPASGVDIAWTDHILDLVRELVKRGKTVCIIEHNLDVVKGLADVAYFLAEGRVVATGTPAQLMADQKLVEIYFGV